MSENEKARFNTSLFFDFALNLKEWELNNLDLFLSSELSQRFFLALARSKRNDSLLRLTDLYVDTYGSPVGVRKKIAQYSSNGLLKVVPDSTDKRSRIVELEPKFNELLTDYLHATNRIWHLTISKKL